MNPQKLDWIIRLIREEMMVANTPGTSGGFSSSSNPKGPTAGYDVPMGKIKKRYIYQKNTRKNWK